MRGELVALDLETTGLDPQSDFIIEVGAVRLNEGKIVDEFTTMVNPGIQVPTHVTHLTGIQQSDVASAPTIESVLRELAQFIGTSPVIAHSVSLDLGFLRGRYGHIKGNTAIDTYELASVMLPRAPRYNLNSLTQQLGIEPDQRHRALSDARAAGLLYWELWLKILALPHWLLQEISAMASSLNWETGQVFTAALRESTTSSQDMRQAAFSFQPSEPGPGAPPAFSDLNTTEAQITAVLGENGQLSRALPGYEFRPQQIEMAKNIMEAFDAPHHLLVEAGTGTGKSIAYLIPAILWATSQGARVIISTNTLNLQDQLMSKDIPLLRAVMGIDFQAAVIKGRANYLCPRRLAAVRRRQPTSVDELRTLAKILVWLLDSQTGDRGEINLHGPVEHTTWQRLSAQDEACALSRCEAMGGICPFYKARKAADAAHLIIANHALLVSDAQSDNRVLPDYQYAIIDEAHQFEDAVTSSLTFHIDQPALMRRLADLGNTRRGLLREILESLNPHISNRELQKLEQFVQIIGEATRLMETHIRNFFDALRTFLIDMQNGRGTEFITLLRVDHSHRDRPGFSQLHNQWHTLNEFFEAIHLAMERLKSGLSRLNLTGIPNFDDMISSAETAARYLEDMRQQLGHFILEPESNSIYWLSLPSGSDNVVIHAAPLHIGPMVEQSLWQRKRAVIMTSATLRSHDSFDYVQDRLYADQVPTLELGSPFNYKESTLIYLPTDIPEPNNRQGYQRAVERGIIELAAALNGRVLALFTSYTQLRQTAQAITPRLALGDISVYDQSDGSSRQTLLEGFQSTEKAVLLGTKSFWEGVDIAGDSLSALIIVRLPFAVPTDPVFSARSDTYTDSFNQYAVPDAIIRFRQGFGRLIRSTTDRGIVTIFDSRILNKSYGASFLEALPECTIVQGSLDKLPEAAQNWLTVK